MTAMPHMPAHALWGQPIIDLKPVSPCRDGINPCPCLTSNAEAAMRVPAGGRIYPATIHQQPRGTR